MKTCSKYQSTPQSSRPNPLLAYIGFTNDLFRLKPLKMAEFVFELVVSGFVISEIGSEWSVTKDYLGYFPALVSKSLVIESHFLMGLVKGSLIFVLLPLIIWFLPYIISRASGSALKLRDYFLNYGIAFIPVIAAAHLDKAILKTTSRIPYFRYLFDDLTGLSTARKIVDGDIILQQSPG